MRPLFALAALVASVNVARAADLEPRLEPPRAPLQPILAPGSATDQIGFYAGIVGGGAFASSEDIFIDQSFDTGEFATRGALVGGTLGFRYATGSWLLALENDFELAHVDGSVTVAGRPFSTRLDWLYNFRARVGYAFDRFVPYFAFGPSFGGLSSTATIPGLGLMSARETRSGWTLGGGLDFNISPSWTAKAEYLFECLGSTTQFSTDNIHFMGHFLRVGLNYNFYSTPVRGADAPRSVPEKAAAGAVYRWTGLYVGGDVGGSAARLATGYDLAGVLVGSVVDKTNGGFRGFGFHGLAGVAAGYNLQIDHLVLGFETDFQFTQLVGNSVNSRHTVTSGGAIGILTGVTELSKLGTVRVRLGFAANRWLCYVDGGFAYGEVGTDSTFSTPGAASSASSAESTPAGWTVGAGFEGALWENWTAKFEYLYVDLGTIHDTFAGSGPFGPITAKSRIDEHIVRVGLNTRFDWFTPH
ncbi:MAG TPA: outer membrane beta-barrel protein [Xanthobacteraceae bacterium]